MRAFYPSNAFAVFLALVLLGPTVACESPERARIVVGGPRYVNDCDAYLSCDPQLRFVSAEGLEVELRVGAIHLAVGISKRPNGEADWSKELLVDVAYDFALDAGIVELPGANRSCTVRLFSDNPDYITVYLIAVVGSEWVNIEARLPVVDVGPFECDSVVDDRRWITLEVDPRRWFDDITPEMLSAAEDRFLGPGDPVADAVLSRITDSITYRFVLPEPE